MTHQGMAAAAAPTIVSASEQMSRIVELARRAGESDAKVLITGESGVGKDVVARAIHAASPRRHRPFVAVNCAGFPESLLETELFGHIRGSFTGADRDRPGKLKLADGGTFFLDEVGEMSPRMQALLLRFLENGEIQTVGDREPRAVDVRIIAATNRNLAERVAAGEFRQDLLYRLCVIQLAVPPLRDRPEDIPALIEHFLRRAPRPIACSDEAHRALRRYRWPGNVRELQNVLEQAVWRTTGPAITPAELPDAVRSLHAGLVASRERRRQVADQLFDGLVRGEVPFWEHVYPLFLERDLTRHDIRALVSRGLSQTKGSYRALLKLFGMPASDYNRFHNFLTAHCCKVDFRTFRIGAPVQAARPADLAKTL
ncbi:MAG TPA: sigma 54-interacting transcriptional regulator [Burkholderiales bacterium]|nr:sigma 54-interacting transcriptional regulator [Burkholderiales bacterium]